MAISAGAGIGVRTSPWIGSMAGGPGKRRLAAGTGAGASGVEEPEGNARTAVIVAPTPNGRSTQGPQPLGVVLMPLTSSDRLVAGW